MIDSEEISPEEIPDDSVEVEPASRAIDPAFAYIILIVVTVIGLRNMAPDVRYTLIWSLMAIVAILALLIDQITIERLLPLSTLTPGKYTLEIHATDTLSNQSISRTADFTVKTPTETKSAANVAPGGSTK